MKKCKKCGLTKDLSEFYTRNGRVHSPCKSCSLKFKRKYDDLRRAPFHPGGHPCSHCGEPCPPSKAGRHPRKFCSKICASRHWARVNYEQNLRVPKEPYGHPCAWCEEPVPEKKVGGKARKYCKRDCAVLANKAEKSTRSREYILAKYGLTSADYDALLAAQDGMCWICRATDPSSGSGTWHVDHCHNTGKVRGLLCSRCNLGLGNFKDDPQRLIRACMYLGADPVALAVAAQAVPFAPHAHAMP